MATVTSLAKAAGGRGNPSSKPYLVEVEIDLAAAATAKGSALAAADVIEAITVGANTVVMSAGAEITAAPAGGNGCTFDLGITGGDVDAFVDGMTVTGASVGDYAFKAGQTPVLIGGTSDTIDIEIQAMTGTTTGGKLRMFAVVMNVDDQGDLAANEVDRDTLA